MDRLTKIVVLAWICAAIALQVWVQTPGWPNLPLIALLVAIVSITLGFFEPKAIAGLLAISYLVPVLVRTFHGGSPYAPISGSDTLARSHERWFLTGKMSMV